MDTSPSLTRQQHRYQNWLPDKASTHARKRRVAFALDGDEKLVQGPDGRDKNPANPDPGRSVRWGQQTFDEMMIGYIEYYTPNTSDVALE